jgi:glucose-6-phosphate 1-dehydrogenase
MPNLVNSGLNMEEIMNQETADAPVFFGATGDLAHKKIFPALEALAKRGNLKHPAL